MHRSYFFNTFLYLLFSLTIILTQGEDAFSYSVTVTSSGEGSGFISSSPDGIIYFYPASASETLNDIQHGTTVELSAIADIDSAVIWKNCNEEGIRATGNINSTTYCTISSLEDDVTLSAEFVKVEGDFCTKYHCGNQDYLYTTEECVRSFDEYYYQNEGEMPACIPKFSDLYYANEIWCYANFMFLRKNECDQYFNCATDQYSVIDEVNPTQYDVCLMNTRAMFDVCGLSIEMAEFSYCRNLLIAHCREEYDRTGDGDAYDACVESMQPQIDECELIDRGEPYITMEMLDLIDSTPQENSICSDFNILLYLPAILANSKTGMPSDPDK